MKRTVCILLLVVAANIALALAKPQKIIAPGDPFPALAITAELSAQQRSYLGLPEGLFSFLQSKSFTIQDIAADIIVIEFFNNYCTSCQAQAPVLNSAFTRVAATQNLNGKVKFIGIGAGNNGREVESFRASKQVAFPLIPDPDFIFYNAIGDPGGTPFIVIVKKKDGTAVAASVHKGLVHEPEYFMQAINDALHWSPGKTVKARSQTADTQPDTRMFTLPLDEAAVVEKVRGSMQQACAGCTQMTGPAAIVLPSGARVYRAETVNGAATSVLYSQVISRKPVCDVCHGIHFIITFDAAGTIKDFTPLHITKYGNVLWQEADVSLMRQKLVGRSLKKHIPFSPEADAVSTATISSSIIFNSVNNLESILEELHAQGK